MKNFFLIKRIVVLSLIFIFISTNGAACSSKTSPNSSQAPSVTITIWRPFDSEAVFKPMIGAYEGSHPGVKIVYSQMDMAEYEENTVDALAGQEGPDIWAIRYDWLYKHNKKLVPMPEGILRTNNSDKRSNKEIYSSTFAPIVSSNTIIGDSIYGLPLSVDTLALYWNKDIFRNTKRELEKSNIKFDSKFLSQAPNTWEEVINAAYYLTKKDGDKITQSGLALGTTNNIDYPYDILSAIMLENNAKMISDDYKTAIFNLPIQKSTGEPGYVGTDALSFYTSFANSQNQVYTWNKDMPNDVTAFVEGKVAMIFGYSYITGVIKQNNPQLSYSISAFPQVTNAASPVDYANYWMETVTKNSKHSDVAWDFLKYINSNGAGGYNTATGRPSPKVNASNLNVAQRAGASNPFTFQVNTATNWFKGKYPLKADAIFSQMIDNIIIYNEPAQKSIDKGANDLTTLLQK